MKGIKQKLLSPDLFYLDASGGGLGGVGGR
jgi:hypothetical protein